MAVGRAVGEAVAVVSPVAGKIVEATEAELAAIVAIDADTIRTRSADKNYRDELLRECAYLDVLVLPSERRRVVAFVNYWIVCDELQLLSLATHLGYQRRGYGRSLMQHLLDVAKARGCESLTLEVRRSNHAAIGLYEASGFRTVAVREKYYADGGEDAQVMRLALHPTATI